MKRVGVAWLKGTDILGEFNNELGEQFVVYRIKGVDQVFVTGEELDWESGWVWDGSRNLTQLFALSEDEYDQLSEFSDELGEK